MKAYHLDPTCMAMSVIDYSGDWRDIGPLLSCRLFTTAQINRLGDTLYVDDEGLLCDPRHWILHRPTGNWYAGKGLILGTDSDGNSTAPACTLAEVRRDFALAQSREAVA